MNIENLKQRRGNPYSIGWVGIILFEQVWKINFIPFITGHVVPLVQFGRLNDAAFRSDGLSGRVQRFELMRHSIMDSFPDIHPDNLRYRIVEVCPVIKAFGTCMSAFSLVVSNRFNQCLQTNLYEVTH
jgi:hypothetical protein